MEQRQFLEGIKLISNFFGSPWPSEAVATAYQSVAELPVESLSATHKRVYVDFPPRPLPAIGRIIEVIKQEAQKINLVKSPEEPKSRREIDNAFQKDNPFGKKYERLGDDSIKLINGYMDGKLSRDGLIEGMLAMDKTYPGIGWNTEASRLIAAWRSDDYTDRKQQASV